MQCAKHQRAERATNGSSVILRLRSSVALHPRSRTLIATASASSSWSAFSPSHAMRTCYSKYYTDRHARYAHTAVSEYLRVTASHTRTHLRVTMQCLSRHGKKMIPYCRVFQSQVRRWSNSSYTRTCELLCDSCLIIWSDATARRLG